MTVILATSLQRLTDGGVLIKYVAERNVLQGSTPLPTLGGSRSCVPLSHCSVCKRLAIDCILYYNASGRFVSTPNRGLSVLLVKQSLTLLYDSLDRRLPTG